MLTELDTDKVLLGIIPTHSVRMPMSRKLQPQAARLLAAVLVREEVALAVHVAKERFLTEVAGVIAQ